MGFDNQHAPANQIIRETDAALFAAAKAGCGTSFDQLAVRCRAYLLHMANQELGGDLRSKLGGSDLVQETLLEARQNFDRFRGETEGELAAWLRQILLHKVAYVGRHYRETAKRDVSREIALDQPDCDGRCAWERPDSAPTPSKQVLAHERLEELRTALGRLSEGYRNVIVLRSIERRSFEDIGRLIERSEKAACKLWLRAVDALRKELSSAHDSR